MADVLIIVGTSLQVYPAASLSAYAPAEIPIYYIDPKPELNHELMQAKNLTVVEDKGTTGVRKVVDDLIAEYA
jgi:NAD-dependent deacetylase